MRRPGASRTPAVVLVAALSVGGLAGVVPGAGAHSPGESPSSRSARAPEVRAQRDPGWGLDRIDQRQLPLDHRYRTRTRGRGVTVYVIDCGAQVGNRQFGGRAVRGPNIAGGRWTDCLDELAVGHATFVSGIIGGATTGVAQRARIVSVRTLKGGEGVPPPPTATEVRRVVRAVDWVIGDAARSDRPAVVNLSLSFDGKHPRLAAAMARLEDAGIPAVVAAGNDGGNACRHVPANVSTALTVGASNRHDRRWAGSNVGRCVDVFAPGVGVRSVLRGGGAFTYRGSGATSWATPYVSGVVALYLSQHPRAQPARVRRWVVAEATRGVLSGLPSSTASRLLFSFAPLR